MGLLSSVEDSPDFLGDVFISAAKLTVLARNALAIDEASRLGRNAFCDGYGEDPENASTNPSLIWRGAFCYVAGATTLTIVTSSSGIQSNDQLRVIRGGTAAAGFADGLTSDFALANGVQVHTITINTAGYADGEPIEVRMYLRNAPALLEDEEYDWGDVDIRDAYISPIQLADPWPGLPTLALDQVADTELQQISNAADWLVRRLSLRREPVFQAIVRRLGPFRDENGVSQATVFWRGSITRTAGHPTLYAQFEIQQKVSGRTEQVRLFVNGSLAATYAVPSSPGIYGATLSASLTGFSAGTTVPIRLDMVKLAPDDDLPDTSRWTVYRVWADPAAGTPATLAEQQPRVPQTFTALMDWLDDLVALLAAAKARIDANGEIWARQTLYRARYGFNDEHFRQFEPGGVAIVLQRQGEALVVRGSGVTLAYGPGRFLEKFNEVGFEEFENFLTETAIDADTIENRVLFLDTLDGLPVGAPYLLRGVNLFGAWEWLKVIE